MDTVAAALCDILWGAGTLYVEIHEANSLPAAPTCGVPNCDECQLLSLVSCMLPGHMRTIGEVATVQRDATAL